MLRILPFLLLAFTATATLKTRNIIVVSTDGLRWQQAFRGADETLMNKAMGGVTEEAVLRESIGMSRRKFAGRS
jgi:hypothetical protein